MRAKAEEVKRRFEQMSQGRSIWEGLWQDLKDYVRPSTDDFYRYTTKGKSQVDKIFDGTAMWALDQLAAGLNSHLTSPTTRWFSLGIDGRAQLTDEELLYLEDVADVVYTEYRRPEVNFAPSIHEVYLDICAFGTAIDYQEYDEKEDHLLFNSFPLVECFVMENHYGRVDTLGRVRSLTALQIRKQFGEDNLPHEIRKAVTQEPSKEFQIAHMVFPREDRDVYAMDNVNKAFASVWFVKDTGDILKEGGFDTFPYHVPRWTKLSGETYGRSPAMSCLPDIRMVNAMAKTLIKGAQKIVDPPLQVPSDGFMLPLRTSPGSLLMHEQGSDLVVPLQTGGRVDIGIEFIGYHRDRIVKSFYVDWLIRGKKKERQTTTEIADDRDEMLRQMAPMLGRLQTELLGPMLARTFDLMVRHNRLPEAPASLEGENIEITYISPAAMAQFGAKAVGIQRYVQGMGQFASIYPDVLDRIDPDAVADEMAVTMDVSRKILRSDEAVVELRQRRAQQQAQQQQLAAGAQVAGALKDASVADKNFRG